MFTRPVLILRAACLFSLFTRWHGPSWSGARRGIHLVSAFGCILYPGAHGGVVTPVPIPNTEVKGPIGESTAGVARGRVARHRVSPFPIPPFLPRPARLVIHRRGAFRLSPKSQGPKVRRSVRCKGPSLADRESVPACFPLQGSVPRGSVPRGLGVCPRAFGRA